MIKKLLLLTFLITVLTSFVAVENRNTDYRFTNKNLPIAKMNAVTCNISTPAMPLNTKYNLVLGIWDLSSITLAANNSITLKIGAIVKAAGSIITNKIEVFSALETDKDSTPNTNN